MKRILMHVAGVAVTFVVSVLCLLFLRGMLTPEPPFVQAPVGTAAPAASEAVEAEPPSEPAHGPEQGSLDVTPDTTAAPAASPVPAAEDRYALATDDVEDTAPPDTSGADVPAAEVPLSDSERDHLARMVRVYEKMRPKQVAQILDTLPDENTVPILEGMSERSAAKVMAVMDPTNAARLTQVLVQDGRP